MQLSERDEREFANQSHCHICKKIFYFKWIERDSESLMGDEAPTTTAYIFHRDKVRDHCHLTGKYRGAAHSNCNLNYQLSRTVPVVFHNLVNYDSHFLIEHLSNAIEGKITIIPKNSEHYISFTKTLDDIEDDVVEIELPEENADEPPKVKRRNEKARLRFIDSYRFWACGLNKLAAMIPFEQMKESKKANTGP